MLLGCFYCCGKVFTTNIEMRRRKFCGVANDILSFRSMLSEDCIMHVVNAQALPILAYGAALWKTNYETKRRIGVCSSLQGKGQFAKAQNRPLCLS